MHRRLGEDPDSSGPEHLRKRLGVLALLGRREDETALESELRDEDRKLRAPAVPEQNDLRERLMAKHMCIHLSNPIRYFITS